MNSLHQHWQIYRDQGYTAVRAMSRVTALDSFYLAILAYGEQQFSHAAADARQAAAQASENLVFQQQ